MKRFIFLFLLVTSNSFSEEADAPLTQEEKEQRAKMEEYLDLYLWGKSPERLQYVENTHDENEDYFSSKFEVELVNENTINPENYPSLYNFDPQKKTVIVESIHLWGNDADKEGKKYEENNCNCSLPLFVGKQHDLLCTVVNELKRVDLNIPKYKDYKNRLLLYGPPGTGKTLISASVKLAGNCSIIRIHGGDVCGYRYGEGKDFIKKVIQQALQIAEKTKRPVIIFIDEFDRIGQHFNAESREQEKDALAELWLQADKHLGNPKLLFMFATNLEPKDLDHRTTSRLHRRIYVKNPPKLSRKEFLIFCLQKYNFSLSEELLESMVNNSEGLSNRNIEALVERLDDVRTSSPNTEINSDLIYYFVNQLKKENEETIKNINGAKEEEKDRRQLYKKQLKK